MNKKLKNIVTVVLFAVLITGFSLTAILGEKKKYTESERRALEPFPKVNPETVFSGEFSSDFEKYATDNFPLRDYFRRIKNMTELNVFGKEDTNGLYLKEGHISKLEYPENEAMINNAAEKITAIYETYLKGTAENIYVSVIPDKGKFLADTKLSLNYDSFEEGFVNKIPFAEHIKISDLLSKDDYYKTDSHWKQEKILPVAEALLSGMGKSLSESFTEKLLKEDFYGVYAGQLSYYDIKDEIIALQSYSIDHADVTSYDTGKAEKMDIYTMDKLPSKDPYEVFLSGANALIEIENPSALGLGHLIIFRDSFASSLAPLLVSEYEKITLVDTRYIAPSQIANFVDFEGADVLFLYSTSIINNSSMLK